MGWCNLATFSPTVDQPRILRSPRRKPRQLCSRQSLHQLRFHQRLVSRFASKISQLLTPLVAYRCIFEWGSDINQLGNPNAMCDWFGNLWGFGSMCVVLPITLRQMEVSIVDPPLEDYISIWSFDFFDLFRIQHNMIMKSNDLFQVDECIYSLLGAGMSLKILGYVNLQLNNRCRW